MIKNAPYKFTEFDSIVFQYGNGDSLVNKYNSKTGEYQYVNNRDSLVKTKLRLSKDDLLYLHRKAADLGFWNFPDVLEGNHKKVSTHFLIQYKYDRKDKKVLFDSAFDGDPKLKDAAVQLTMEIQKVLSDAEDRKN
ncbi:MAG: hypothetical protein ACOH2A_11910 [Sphingobacteriaceae bacterium]